MWTVNCAQGSDEWFAARCGVVTGSNFRLARQREAKNSRRLTEAADDYAFHLACERVTGQPSEAQTYETWAMKRGRRLEPDARARHMVDIGLYVQEVGMVLTDDRAFGVSADGWIDGDGGAEYKCLVAATSVKEIFLWNDITFYMDQVMGNLWVSGRRWWDFCVYCPQFAGINLDFLRQRVERDEEYIEKMAYELNDFNNVVNAYTDVLTTRAARYGAPLTNTEMERFRAQGCRL
jgi:hypothetical protein